jgi:hypothetical protein
MNIAYMILAHHQPLQLARLVDRLNQSNAYFYIHVDKKSKEKDRIVQQFAALGNVTVIANNEVNWMGFTTIDAEVDLMKEAYNSGINFKYYVLLSGQDYPIKSNAYINNFFSTHSNDFLSYNRISYMNEGFKNKHRQYHFRDIPYINPRNPKKIPLLVYLYFGLHNRFAKYVPARRFYQDMELYFGSQWFALTHETIGYILQYLKEHKGFIRSMKNTDGPDETFFHTIIMNSERKTNVYDYDRFMAWLKVRKEDEIFIPGYSSLRYMDWSGKSGSKPAVLDMSYYETLAESDDLFARKFDEQSSAELMDKLDKTIL